MLRKPFSYSTQCWCAYGQHDSLANHVCKLQSTLRYSFHSIGGGNTSFSDGPVVSHLHADHHGNSSECAAVVEETAQTIIRRGEIMLSWLQCMPLER
jgi:hypothetical protein